MSQRCPHCQHLVDLSADVSSCDAADNSALCNHCGKQFPRSAPLFQHINIAGISLGELLARGLNTVHPQDQERWEPPTPEQLSSLLPQYKIESFLGRGGMGAVYKGCQERLQRVVAIKLLPNELAEDLNFVNRFEREAQTLAKLDHPGIITVYDFGQTAEGHLYFVMEFVDGTDLHRLICGEGLDPIRALEIISQVCDALQYAHSLGVIHRDIKPANVLVTKDGRVKLADFGLARPLAAEVDGRLTVSRMVMGTPDYMAPEQKQGQGDHRVDLYALGVMLYEMLCGKPPQGAWQPPSQRVRVDIRLDQVVIKAMQEEPNLRYQQALQVKTDLDAIRSTSIDGNPTTSEPKASDSRTQKPRLSPLACYMKWISAVSLCILTLVAWILWIASSGSVIQNKTPNNETTNGRIGLNEFRKPEYRTLISANFDGPSPFGEKKATTWETYRENGHYVIRRHDFGCLWFTASASEAGDSTIVRVKARISDTDSYAADSATAFWGIGFRSSGNGVYRVEVRGTGDWRFYYSKGQDFQSISPWKSSPAIHPAGNYNDLVVKAAGAQFEVSINGSNLGSFKHQGPRSGCQQLLFASQGDALLECDDFELLEQIQ